MKRVVAVSGGFDPLHIGHVRMFEEAKKQGDYLVVIVNGDDFLLKKKGFIFMSQKERSELIEKYSFVDEVYLLNPKDKDDMTVCEALENIKPQVFANGGDRFSDNIPEAVLCKKLGIETVFNIGGGKIQSSSDMLKNAISQINSKNIDNRPWGSFEVLMDTESYKVKILKITPNGILSLQRHKHRSEHWYVVKGEATVRNGDKTITLKEGEHTFIPKGNLHRLENRTDLDLELIEVQSGTYFGEDDIERLEDVYGRK